MRGIFHTPGPWFAQRDERGDRYEPFVIYGGPHSFYIARVNKWAENPSESEANARLIAAAPEMLETLEQIRDEDTGLEYGPGDDDAVISDFKHMARAVIIKARGE